MSELGGRGPMSLWTMWIFTILSLFFVCLRIYTRAFLVHGIGADDYIFTLSWVLGMLYTVFVTISAMHGFGRRVAELDGDNAAAAIYSEMIGQTFVVIGMATAKISLGLFLLRVVVSVWHKVVLWIAIISISIISILTDIIFWVQCFPTSAIYDIRVKGTCHVKIEGFAVALAAWCVVEDFFLAAFPWYFIWGVQMKRKEKLTVAGSLSLGVIAGICGIFRTMSLSGFDTSDYTYDTVDLIIWSGAELCITLICIAIPVLRPLYKVVRGQGSTSDRVYEHSGDPTKNSTVDGGAQNYTMNNIRQKVFSGKSGMGSEANAQSYYRENSSDESILGPEYRANGIKATREIIVSYSNGTAADGGHSV